MSMDSLKLPDAIAAMQRGIDQLERSVAERRSKMAELDLDQRQQVAELQLRKEVLTGMQNLDKFYTDEGKGETIKFLIPSGDTRGR